jgi:subtilisin family serine protease
MSISNDKKIIPTKINNQRNKIQNVHNSFKENIESRFASKKILNEYSNIFNGVALDISENEANEIKKLDYVKEVYPNYLVNITLDESVPLINADDVWNLGYTGEGVKIAVIDTGITYRHPDLGGCYPLHTTENCFDENEVQIGYCKDSDGGKNYCTKGTVVIDKSTPTFKDILTHYDYCDSATSLVEKYCTESGELGIETVTCPNGCSGGMCLPAKININDGSCDKVIGGHNFVTCNAFNFDTGDCIAPTTENDDPLDDYGHGTHCAGIAAGTGKVSDGKYKGVAPGAKLMAVKVMNGQGIGFSSWIISGIEWSIQHGANVISMSLGGGGEDDGSDPLSQAVDTAVDNGVVVVVAAGNSGSHRKTISIPGSAKKAITVGATYKNDSLASFSSRGYTGDGRMKPDVIAPGVGITSTIRRSKYTSMSGTSMATPHVAGVAALLKQAHPDWTTEQVKSAIIITAEDMGLNVLDQGNGGIDALRAVNTLVASSPPVLDFGLVEGGTVLTKTFTLTNLHDQDLYLELTTTDVKNDGQTFPGIASLNVNNLMIRQDSSETVTLTIDTSSLPNYFFSGFVIINVNGETYRIPFSFFIKERMTFDMSLGSIVPTIDGRIEESEWSDANVYSNLGENGNFDKIYLKAVKDGSEDFMFVGIRFKKSGSSTFNLLFDEGDNGWHGSGTRDYFLRAGQEDRKVLNSFYKKISDTTIVHDVGSMDGYSLGWVNYGIWWCAIGYSPHYDFNFYITSTETYTDLELKMPFKGVERHSTGFCDVDQSDLNVSYGDSIGFHWEVKFGENKWYLLPENSDGYDALTYGTINILNTNVPNYTTTTIPITTTTIPNTTNQTGKVIDITSYTDPDEGLIEFQAITEGFIDYVRFEINFNAGAWQNIGDDYSYPYIVNWSDAFPRSNVRIQATPYTNGNPGQGRVEGPFQYLGPGNQTNTTITTSTTTIPGYTTTSTSTTTTTRLITTTTVPTSTTTIPGYTTTSTSTTTTTRLITTTTVPTSTTTIPGYTTTSTSTTTTTRLITTTPTTTIPEGRTCTDSDGGIDYYVKGTVYTTEKSGGFVSTGTYYDLCWNNGPALHEWYCGSDNKAVESIYTCPYGCSNGACLTSIPSGSFIRIIEYITRFLGLKR